MFPFIHLSCLDGGLSLTKKVNSKCLASDLLHTLALHCFIFATMFSKWFGERYNEEAVIALWHCLLQISLTSLPLTELSNPGASGSVFFITEDDEFIIKTVQHKEADFLQKLLPGYYMVSTYRHL